MSTETRREAPFSTGRGGEAAPASSKKERRKKKWREKREARHAETKAPEVESAVTEETAAEVKATEEKAVEEKLAEEKVAEIKATIESMDAALPEAEKEAAKLTGGAKKEAEKKIGGFKAMVAKGKAWLSPHKDTKMRFGALMSSSNKGFWGKAVFVVKMLAAVPLFVLGSVVAVLDLASDKIDKIMKSMSGKH